MRNMEVHGLNLYKRSREFLYFSWRRRISPCQKAGNVATAGECSVTAGNNSQAVAGFSKDDAGEELTLKGCLQLGC